jgi:hypothetical protein
VGKALWFTGEQQDTILNHFISGGDRTAGGSCKRSPPPRS